MVGEVTTDRVLPVVECCLHWGVLLKTLLQDIGFEWLGVLGQVFAHEIVTVFGGNVQRRVA